MRILELSRACLPILLLLGACSRPTSETPYALAVRGRAHHENGDFGAARAAFETLAHDTEEADAWVNVGLTAAADGDGDAAERAWATALQLEPANARALLALARSLQERAASEGGGDAALARQRLENAADLLERAVAAAPADAGIQAALGEVRRDLGDADSAERAFAAARGLDPVDSGLQASLRIVLPPPQVAPAGQLPMHYEPERTPLRAGALLAVADEPVADLALLGRGRLARADSLAGAVRWQERAFAAGLEAGLARTADLDADGRFEVVLVCDAPVAGSQAAAASDVWLASGADLAPQRLAQLPTVRCIEVCDWDRDGDLDLILACAEAPGLRLYDNQGGLRFAARAIAGAVLPGLLDVACADMTGDARLDVACVDLGGKVWFLGQRSDGTLVDTGKVSGLARERGRTVQALDVDADGLQDLLVGNDTGLWVFANRGGGRFARQGAYRVPRTSWSGWLEEGIGVVGLELLDYDGDGLQDVLTLHPVRQEAVVAAAGGTPSEDTAPPAWNPLETVTQASMRLWRNDGRGVFLEVSAKLNLGRERLAVSMPAIGDFDGDGDADLAAVLADSTVQVYWNRGGEAHRRLLVRAAGGGTLAGTRLDLWSGERRLHADIHEHTAWIGTGGLRRFDVVRVAWPDGSVYNDLDVEVGDSGVLEVERRR